MLVCFWISSVFALNLSTDLISMFTQPPGTAVLVKFIRLIPGRESVHTLEEGFEGIQDFCKNGRMSGSRLVTQQGFQIKNRD